MKKLLTLLALMLIVVPAMAFAWHCEDTDEERPDLQGTSYGPWGDNYALGGTTWGWHDVGVVLPEGCTQTDNFEGTCDDLCVGFTLREFSCEDRPNYAYETVITWTDYPNSIVCGGEEVPEFGTYAVLGILGALGFVVYKRRN